MKFPEICHRCANYQVDEKRKEICKENVQVLEYADSCEWFKTPGKIAKTKVEIDADDVTLKKIKRLARWMGGTSLVFLFFIMELSKGISLGILLAPFLGFIALNFVAQKENYQFFLVEIFYISTVGILNIFNYQLVTGRIGPLSVIGAMMLLAGIIFYFGYLKINMSMFERIGFRQSSTRNKLFILFSVTLFFMAIFFSMSAIHMNANNATLTGESLYTTFNFILIGLYSILLMVSFYFAFHFVMKTLQQDRTGIIALFFFILTVLYSFNLGAIINSGKL